MFINVGMLGMSLYLSFKKIVKTSSITVDERAVTDADSHDNHVLIKKLQHSLKMVRGSHGLPNKVFVVLATELSRQQDSTTINYQDIKKALLKANIKPDTTKIVMNLLRSSHVPV